MHDDKLPPDAIGLIKMLDRENLWPQPMPMELADDKKRLDMAAQIGVRMLIDTLKTRYQVNA